MTNPSTNTLARHLAQVVDREEVTVVLLLDAECVVAVREVHGYEIVTRS
jgi:hypothetical protein